MIYIISPNTHNTTPQEYRLSSLAYFRQWAADMALDSLALYTKQLRGTVYLPIWYRLMGARLGRFTEVSSFEHVSAERLTLGDQAFVADDVVIGRPQVDAGGLVTHDHVRCVCASWVCRCVLCIFYT